MTGAGRRSGAAARPSWVNYGAAVVIQAALTALLRWMSLDLHFPLGNFPAPYAAALLATVLVFGVGPAVVALVLSLFLFWFFFVPPVGVFALPADSNGWAMVVAYVLVTNTVVAAVAVIQKGRRRAERLAESLREHAMILDLAHVLIRDMDDRIVVWNTGLEALYGYSREEAVGRVSHDLFQTVFSISQSAIKHELDSVGYWQGELTHTAKDGSKITVASHQVLHRDREGRPVAILEVNNDISGRIQAQRALEMAVRELAVANEDKEVMNEELLVTNEELHQEIVQRREAEGRYQTLFASMNEGFALCEVIYDINGNACDFRYLELNDAFEKHMGIPVGDAIGKTARQILPGLEPMWIENYAEVAETGQPCRFEGHIEQLGRDFEVSVFSPGKGRFAAVFVDITTRKRAEREREITVDFLQLVNDSRNTDDLIHDAALFFEQESGCEAVGIRLRQDDDYPYFEARGFSGEFVQAENSLCAVDDAGCTMRDDEGYPICACMCGNIIQGRFDPSKPFFTEHGSFWTNSTSHLLDTSSEADRQSRTRNRCNGEGYESVALVPLHVGNDRLGLLQLNDRREGMFSPESVGLWERFADYLAVAITKFQAEEALRDSEARLHLAQEAANAGAWEWDLRTNENVWSEEIWKLYGLQPHECEPSYQCWRRTIHPDDVARAEQAVAEAAEKQTELIVEYRVRDLDGSERWLMSRGRPVLDDKGHAIRFIGIVMDITQRKRAETAMRELEAHKLEFYRQTILAATEGKLVICEAEEIESLAGTPLGKWDLSEMKDVGTVRVQATSLAREAGLNSPRLYDFMGCVVESVGNAVKHANSGAAALYRQDGSLLFVVSDSGAGIGALSLPDVALTRGYTTAGTLGMGYKVMIGFADKIYLATAPEGTTVAVLMSLRVPDEARERDQAMPPAPSL